MDGREAGYGLWGEWCVCELCEWAGGGWWL